MKLDFSEIKETKTIPAGITVLTIKNAKETVSQNGTPMLQVDMLDEEEGFVRDNVCLAGPGAFKASQFHRALGLSKEDFEEMAASDLIGMTLQAEIIIEEYQGQERSKVKKYLA